MKVTITPGKLSGTIQVPPPRARHTASSSAQPWPDGTSRIHNLAHSQDICATLD